MAQFTSHIYSNITGSVAGIRYTTTNSGKMIALQRTHQHRTPSNAQVAHNSYFSGANELWKSMSESDRIGWQKYARTCTRADALHLAPDSGRLTWISTYLMMQVTYKPNGYTNDLRVDAPIKRGLIKPVINFMDEPTPFLDRYRWNFSGLDTERYGLYLFVSAARPGWSRNGSDTYPAGWVGRVLIDPGSTRNIVWTGFERNSTYNIELKGVSAYNRHRLTSPIKMRLHTPAAF